MVDFVDSPIGDIPTISIDSGGLFTPGAAYAIKLSADLVNKCVALAEAKDVDFTERMDDLTNATTGWLALNQPDDVTTAGIANTPPTEPSMTISDTSVGLFTGNFATQSATIISAAATKFTEFMTAWFPNNTTTFDAAEAYLLEKIGNTTDGAIPAAIKSAMLTSARDTILAEEDRAVSDLYEAQAARRHRFPTGAAAGQARRIAQGALDAIAKSAREIGIKDFELTHQTALEAVRMAISSRATALQAAQQYIAGVVAAGYGAGQQVTAGAHQAEVAKLSAAYQAFAGRTNAAKLALEATQANAAITLDVAKANQARDMQDVENYMKSFLAHAHMVGAQLVGMLNNLRAGSSATYSVSA